MKVRIPRIKTVVQVTFKDHVRVSGPTEKPAICTVWGPIVRKDKDSIVVRNWETANDDGTNNEESVILKGAITEIVVLLPKQVTKVPPAPDK